MTNSTIHPEASSSFNPNSQISESILTPKPQSQSLFQSYGSILPTSLTYIVPSLEAAHLGDLLRLSVRPVAQRLLPPPDFHGPSLVLRTRPWRALPAPVPPRRLIRFRGPRLGQVESSLYPAPRLASPGSLTSPSTPRNWFRNLVRIPFRRPVPIAPSPSGSYPVS